MSTTTTPRTMSSEEMRCRADVGRAPIVGDVYVAPAPCTSVDVDIGAPWVVIPSPSLVIPSGRGRCTWHVYFDNQIPPSDSRKSASGAPRAANGQRLTERIADASRSRRRRLTG